MIGITRHPGVKTADGMVWTVITATFSVCGFDTRMPGYSYHKLEKFDSADEILKRMENEKQEQ